MPEMERAGPRWLSRKPPPTKQTTRRFALPGEERLDIGCGVPSDEERSAWNFMDGFVDDPDVLKHDLTRFPYPFPDGQFDVVRASHVMEHIPFIFTDHGGTRRDVLFGLMEEVHRVLKPGGRFHIIVPVGASDSAFANPQHYRHWHPAWFRFFDQRSREASWYHSADFRLEKLRFNRLGYRWRHAFRLGESRLGLAEHLAIRFPRLLGPVLSARDEMEAVLVARK